MRNFLRRLIPRSENHLLMARLPTPPGAPLSPERAGVRVERVADASAAGADRLEGFATANGFPAGWVADMLTDGAAATVIVDVASERPVGMGWATRRPFVVEEIGVTFDPGGGVYLFGDFVAPDQRGRRLQGLLVAERVQAAAPHGRACTIVHPANVASVRNYEREGFGVLARFRRYRWRGRTWARCGRTVGIHLRFELDPPDVLRARWSS
jgi:ribosomal protein S18 acetylase RimI-like enzyme